MEDLFLSHGEDDDAGLDRTQAFDDVSKQTEDEYINLSGDEQFINEEENQNNDFSMEEEIIGENGAEDAKQMTYKTHASLDDDSLNEYRPYVGMELQSQEDAYDFYNRYAGKVGFSIRKHTTSLSRRSTTENKIVIGRVFCCACQGKRDARAKPVEQLKRKQANTRTGCDAQMVIRKRAKDKWIVTHVVEEHNHLLVSPSKRHNLKSLRKMSKRDKQIVDNLRRARIKTNLAMNFLAVSSGGVQNVGFTTKDARNYLTAKRTKELKNGDAQAVLDYFQREQANNPSFFCSIQVDSEGKMANFFWADARSRVDYYHFGDIVCFDPTYCTNRYGMPFVPIVGVNHHYQTTLFGGALLHSESEESFEWVMKTWMRAMHGRQPKVILTDQESAIAGAIRNILPGTRHRYCLWHISRLASKHLSHAINKYPAFIADFNKCLYGNETIEEFEAGWESMLNTYKLTDNEWLLKLYKKKEKWASVYTRDIFCADMYTTQRSESINAYFDHFMRRDMPLCEFIRQYEMAIAARREAENNEDYETKHRKPLLKFSVNIEQEASLIYTKTVFYKFQEQLAQGLHYCQNEISRSGTKSTYQVWRFGHETKNRTIIYDSNDKSIQCSCLLYEFAGYLCRHILKIFSIVNIQSIPPQYVLKRWTVDAKSGSIVSDQGEEFVDNSHDTATIRYSKLCQDAINIAIKGSTSTEIYNVTKTILDRALKEVDEALKNLPGKSTDQAQDDSIIRVECVENTPMPQQNPILDPTIVPTKGRTGKMKSFLDKKDKKRKADASTRAAKTSKKSTSTVGSNKRSRNETTKSSKAETTKQPRGKAKHGIQSVKVSRSKQRKGVAPVDDLVGGNEILSGSSQDEEQPRQQKGCFDLNVDPDSE